MVKMEGRVERVGRCKVICINDVTKREWPGDLIMGRVSTS